MASDREVALWVVVGILSLLVLSSFTGVGTGLFGWGFMMGMMWLWMLLPVILIVVLVLALSNQQNTDDRPNP